jgi:hypothetical protein
VEAAAAVKKAAVKAAATAGAVASVAAVAEYRNASSQLKRLLGCRVETDFGIPEPCIYGGSVISIDAGRRVVVRYDDGEERRYTDIEFNDACLVTTAEAVVAANLPANAPGGWRTAQKTRAAAQKTRATGQKPGYRYIDPSEPSGPNGPNGSNGNRARSLATAKQLAKAGVKPQVLASAAPHVVSQSRESRRSSNLSRGRGKQQGQAKGEKRKYQGGMKRALGAKRGAKRGARLVPPSAAAFGTVWGSLQEQGWKVERGGDLEDFRYVRPGAAKHKKDQAYAIDYWRTEAEVAQAVGHRGVAQGVSVPRFQETGSACLQKRGRGMTTGSEGRLRRSRPRRAGRLDEGTPHPQPPNTIKE